MIRTALFILCTIFFIYFSRHALKNPAAHGYYRFFIFEGILLLVLLNHPYWFSQPLSPLHLLSWFFLFISISFVVQSVLMLKRYGGNAERDEMPENHPFENTVTIVETGLYHYIRHPMYSSLLFLTWGAFLKRSTPLTLGLTLLITILLFVAAKVEEQENICFFGRKYADYMQRTKMFIPWLF